MSRMACTISLCTDPPYYDAIPYSDLMDFFYVWLRRVLRGHLVSNEISQGAYGAQLGPKWDAMISDNGELIDRCRAVLNLRQDPFQTKPTKTAWLGPSGPCLGALQPDDGRLVVVFREQTVRTPGRHSCAALIRAGFVVDGSWPIQTEMRTKVRLRSVSSAALASSIWIVCKKRPACPPRVGQQRS